MAFLKRELAATQARICQLDALNDDKDKRIKVLLDRIKFLEERDNKSTYDKYFPENYNDERPGTSARASYTHHEPLNDHTQSCCWPSAHCPRHRPPCSCAPRIPPEQSNQHSSSEVAMLVQHLGESLKLLMSLIDKLLLISLKILIILPYLRQLDP